MFTRRLSVLFAVFFSACLFLSCKKKNHPQLAFYHWKLVTTPEGTASINKALHYFKTEQLFVKIMDIDWDAVYGAYPSTSVGMSNIIHATGMEYPVVTPVVFITNLAIEKTDSTEIDELAQKIVLKTAQLIQGRKVKVYGEEKTVIDTSIHYSELQLDCDWTEKTQKKYFALLTAIKKQLPQKLVSSTLRLHQYKYPGRTGIPPADELYLMCYNTGEVKNTGEKNSIFDYGKAKVYFENTKTYPKKLNFALPVFDWVIIFRQNRFYKIDNNIGEELFANAAVMKPSAQNSYTLQKDTVLNNNFLRKGDVLRWEKITDESVQQAASLCSKAINSDTFKVVFYDIDHINPTKYESIQKAFGYFNF